MACSWLYQLVIGLCAANMVLFEILCATLGKVALYVIRVAKVFAGLCNGLTQVFGPLNISDPPIHNWNNFMYHGSKPNIHNSKPSPL